MRTWIWMTACAAGAITVACGQPTPHGRVFDQMQRAACSGNADGYFAHVDKPRLTESIAKEGLEKMKLEPNEHVSEESLLAAAKGGAATALEGWRKSIEQDSKESPICRADVEKNPPPVGSSGKLIVDIPSNGLHELEFEQQGADWKLVGYRAASGRAR